MSSAAQNVRVVGRYALYGGIAAGGMATVHLGRLLGPVGFSRTVAIKRLHAQFASDPEFVSMFLDEARLAARIRHPNVVPTLDVVAADGELFLVMEYVPGESVARLARALRDRDQSIPTPILSAVMAGALHGLHAAHEARDEHGQPLGIVHRDISPQNVLVGTDGVARILDFGVAKAAGRMQTTREGQLKGKLSYMAPEQLTGKAVSRQSDIYAAGVMLWELVTGRRLFTGDNEGAVIAKVLDARIEPPSAVLAREAGESRNLSPELLRELGSLDATILRALHKEPEARFATARELAIEIERKLPPATGSEVADWVEHIAEDVLQTRATMVAEIESGTSLQAVEPHGGHVQSVLQAGAGQSVGGDLVPLPAPSAPTVTRLDRPNPSRPPPGQTTGQTTGQTSPLPDGATIPRADPVPFPEGPPFTQPSSISVASGAGSLPAPPARASAARPLTAVVIGLLLGAGVLAGALAYRRAQDDRTPSTEPTAAASVPTSGQPGAPGRAEDLAPASAPASASASAPASASASATPPDLATVVPTPPPARKPTPQASRSATVSAKPVAPAASATSAAVDCSTPVWFDAQGVKHYKPQCLGN